MNGLNDIVAQDAKEAVKWACNRNLLDNWYFVGGGSQLGDGQFPINQRGAVQDLTGSYFVDRWVAIFAELQPDGIKVSSTGWLNQFIAPAFIEALEGKTVTFSCLTTTDLITGTFIYRAGQENLTVGSNSALAIKLVEKGRCVQIWVGFESVIVAAKLELGGHQTLAHKEGDTWVLNRVPDFREELAKCQTYYWESEMAFESNTVVENNHLLCNVKFPVAMRTTPQVTILANDKTENAISGWATGAVVLKDVHVNGFTLTKEGFNALYSDSGFTPGGTYSFKVRADANP